MQVDLRPIFKILMEPPKIWRLCMSRRLKENTGFICQNCGCEVVALTNGSYRNHCPFCLYSLHVDNKPGDRNSLCKGLMRPTGLTYNSKKGYQITHSCQCCGVSQRNKVATNTLQEDDMDEILLL